MLSARFLVSGSRHCRRKSAARLFSIFRHDQLENGGDAMNRDNTQIMVPALNESLQRLGGSMDRVRTGIS
jgi:hypothetical protein